MFIINTVSIIFRIRPNIPTLKDTEPLLELDRDERKFDIFLTFHRSSLLVSDLKIFLPFTINLDPYLKKVIKGKLHLHFCIVMSPNNSKTCVFCKISMLLIFRGNSRLR